MKTKKVKEKKCKHCKKMFTPSYNSTQGPCSWECAAALAKMGMEKERKKIKKNREKLERQEKRELDQSRIRHPQWLSKFQKLFNLFIRYRDKDLNCISCGRYVENIEGDASHFWSVKPYYGVRFNEDNVHRSCDECNTHLHGNLAEYQIRLVLKIGLERFEYLKSIRHIECRISILEIKEQIIIYKSKIKQLKQ